MKKQIIAILIILAISLVFISGCMEEFAEGLKELEEEGEQPTPTEAKLKVYYEVQETDREGRINTEGLKVDTYTYYEAFENECGSGIIVTVVEMPYWVVKGDTVYCLNGFAKTYTPDFEYFTAGEEDTCILQTYIL